MGVGPRKSPCVARIDYLGVDDGENGLENIEWPIKCSWGCCLGSPHFDGVREDKRKELVYIEFRYGLIMKLQSKYS